MKLLRRGCFFLSLIIIGLHAFSQDHSPADTFPVPRKDPNMLFYLQRQPNTNTIIVTLNTVNGEVNPKNPVNVFWRRYQEDGQKENLNFIQRTFAYGIHSKEIAKDVYDLNFVSYKKMKFRLEKNQQNRWQVYGTQENGNPMVLNRIYIHINGGSMWKPNVEYVELKGSDPRTHQEIRERVGIKY